MITSFPGHFPRLTQSIFRLIIIVPFPASKPFHGTSDSVWNAQTPDGPKHGTSYLLATSLPIVQ